MHVVREKRDPGESADQGLLHGIWLWSRKYKHRRSVCRRNGKPTVSRFSNGVKGKPKAKLMQIKLQASFLVPDVDGYCAETYIRILTVWMKTAPVCLKGMQGGPHVLGL